MNDEISASSATGSSESSAEFVDRICDEFEREWKAGGRPLLERYVERVPEVCRQELLAELLRVEYHWRCQRGEDPRPGDYAGRVEDMTLLVEVFDSHHAEFAGNWRQWGRIEGRYELRRELGRGRFGVVFLALELPLDRLVAIKFQLPGGDAGTDEPSQRLLREAQTAGQFSHPHVVQVYYSGRARLTEELKSIPFVVFQYVDGVSLDEVLRQQAPDVRTSVSITAVLAEALQACHDRGFVHRDVKPANVLIERESGRPYLTDFGLSVRSESPSQVGVIAGSPCYMSPEQAAGEGHRVNGSSDQFSLGAMFYELLTGTRPFQRLSDVLKAAPVALKEKAFELPDVLERICLKMLARERSQRFDSCGAVSLALRDWLRSGSSGSAVTSTAGDSEQPSAERPIRPRGLGAFSDADADVYPELLSGPVGLSGLPVCLEFWKQFFESPSNDEAGVGLLYGPSGCGKSSFLQAGLIPRLSADVRVLLVQCTASGTERSIVRQLEGRGPARSESTVDLVACLSGYAGSTAPKLVLILDQFEQWLHANPLDSRSALIRGLRHCDGVRIQALVVVREEFWVAAGRFGAALDVQFHEGRNALMLDLLPLEHARRVLARFGRGLGRIAAPPTDEQEEFLREAVDSLQQGGLASPIQLSLLSEALLERPWTVESLREIGGASGAGLLLLRENLSPQSRRPEQRYFSRPAQLLLASLMPAPGMQIRGGRKSQRELQVVVGTLNHAADFQRLLELLVTQLRLVTLCAPEDGSDGPRESGEADQHYELTHDYLVPILREWLRENLQGTREGRARLLLEERTLQWQSAGQPGRLLPSLSEWWQIRLHVPTRLQTELQQRMLRQIAERWRQRLIMGFCLTCMCALAAVQVERWISNGIRERETAGLVSGVASARMEELGEWVHQLRVLEGAPLPLLSQALRDSTDYSEQQLNLLLTVHALGYADADVRDVLQERLPGISLDRIAALDESMMAWDHQLTATWTSLIKNTAAPPRRRLCAICLLIPGMVDHGIGEDGLVTPELSATLINELCVLPPGELVAARKLLAGFGSQLVPELLKAFESAAANSRESANLGELLMAFASDDPEALGAAVLIADASADAVLFPVFAGFGDKAVRRMRDVLREPWSEDGLAGSGPADLPSSLQDRFANAGGVAKAEFLFLPSIPWGELEDLCEELRPYHFRPRRIRSAAGVSATGSSPQRLLDVVWVRDNCKWLLDTSCNVSSLTEPDGGAMRDGLPLSELVLIDESVDRDGRFVAVWSESGVGSGGCRCIAGVTAEEMSARLETLDEDEEFRTVTSLSVGLDDQGVARYSAILRQHGPKSACALSWDGVERFDWPQSDLSAVADSEGKLHRAALWLQEPLQESLLVPAVSRTNLAEQIAQYVKNGWRIVSSAAAAAADGGEPRVTLLLQRPAIVESQRQWLGSRRAAAATALLRLNEAEDVLPLVSTGIEPETEASLLHRLASCNVPSRTMERLLHQAISPGHGSLTVNQRRFLILAAGEYGEAGKASSLTAECVNRLLEVYAEDPDPGIHGAAEWSLRQLGKGDSLKSIWSDPATGKPEAGRRWYLQAAADRSMPPITMAVLQGPHEFLMGSPLREWERNGGLDGTHERRHRRRIPRTFAIGMHEITVEQFRRFRSTYRKDLAAADTSQLPATQVTWYDAVEFCNWLSEQAGIPRDQWCYDPDATFGDGMRLVPDAVRRTGYRLPTEAEWEYACRAGTDTVRYFGEGDEHLSRYCRYAEEISGVELLPVASLRPNPFGLFDTLGNAAEWCQESSYSVDEFSGVITEPPQAEFVSNEEPWGRLIRGGSIYSTPPLMRAAERMAIRADTMMISIGFRVARTLVNAE
jgi:serine/threonine protein kinase/formylglycine-generating enzyme required for sulfatase activity